MMHGLRIETTSAQIAIDTRWPKVELNRTPPETTMTTHQPAVMIDIDWPQVDLNMTDALAEIGLKRSVEIARDYRSLGQQKANEAVARMARDGDTLAKIEEHHDTGAVIGRIAWPPQFKELNIVLIPTSPIEVNVQGDLDISWAQGSVDLSVKRGEVDVRAHMGGVTVTMAVKPKVEIHSVGTMYSAWA